jgi:4-amino-4-deoxy-L-arabinose transferase-like glycosyltransferase
VRIVSKAQGPAAGPCYSPGPLQPANALKLAALAAAAALSLFLGSTPLLDADEGRNAEVAREMALTNDYFVPRLNGLPYLDKPIVYFAAAAAVMELLGPTEVAARLPAYLFTLATAWLLYWWAKRRLDEERALIAVITFLATPLTIAFARIVIFDSALTFFIVLAIVAFFEAIETRERKWAALAWTAMAFGVLTKGPVALLLPLLAAIPYSLWRRASGAIWSFLGLVLFAVVIAPWVWAVSQVVPEFLRYVLVTETAARMATDELRRTGPPWYFVPYFLVGALPWVIAAIASWRAMKRRDPLVVYLLLWILVPLVFFSLSQSKRPQYILPLMPPVAMLIAAIWPEVKMRAAAVLSAVVGGILIGAAFVPQLSAKLQPSLRGSAVLVALMLGALFLAGGIVATLTKNRRVAMLALAAPVLLLPSVSTPLLDAIAERRSAHLFAEQIQPHLTPQTEVIGVEAFTGSMAFYLRRPVILASDNASELTSNYLIRHYGKFSRTSGSTLRPLSWYQQSLGECCVRRIYIVRHKDPEHSAALRGKGMPLIATGSHHAAYLDAN